MKKLLKETKRAIGAIKKKLEEVNKVAQEAATEMYQKAAAEQKAKDEKGKKNDKIDRFLDGQITRGGGRPGTPVFGFDPDTPAVARNPLRRGRAPGLGSAGAAELPGFPGLPDQVTGIIGG